MLTKRGKYWHYKFQHNGQQYRGTTGCTNRRAAEAEARRIRVELEQAAPKARRGQLSICELEAYDIARAADEGLGKQRQDTIEGLWSPLHRLMLPDVARLTIGAVMEYVGKRRREGVRGQTIRREVQALVRALRIAKRDDGFPLPFDPADLPRIKSDPPKEAQRGKLWRLEQIEAVLGKLSKKAITAGHLDRCRLILLTGLRLEELHRLRPGWVVATTDGGNLLHIPAEAAKWGKARTIPLCDDAIDIIDRCAPFARKKPNKSLTLASERAKLPGVLTPRDLRTFYLDLAARLSGDPVAAQRLGGHTNIATTGLYLHGDTERAMAAGIQAATWIGQKWSQSGGHNAIGQPAESGENHQI